MVTSLAPLFLLYAQQVDPAALQKALQQDAAGTAAAPAASAPTDAPAPSLPAAFASQAQVRPPG